MNTNAIVKAFSVNHSYALNLLMLSVQHPTDFLARKPRQNADVQTLSAPYYASQCENDCTMSKFNTHANNCRFQFLMSHRPRMGSEEHSWWERSSSNGLFHMLPGQNDSRNMT